MARKTQNTTPEQQPKVDTEVVRTDLAALDAVSQMKSIQDDALEVGKLVGRAESMLFLRTCAERVIAETFIQLKEGKKYKSLGISDESGNVRACADLKEACEYFFGKSYRACAEIVENYELLGADLYDKALQLGLQRNDYRAIRALPADDQALIETTLGDAASREAVADLIETLTERHAKKLAEIEKKLTEERENGEAKDRIIADNQERQHNLQKKLAAYEGDRVPADARLETVVEATEESGKAIEKSARDLWAAFEAADTVVSDIFGKPLSDQDAAGARLAVSRIRDQINRTALVLAELQFNFEHRLQPVLAGHEEFLLQTGQEA